MYSYIRYREGEYLSIELDCFSPTYFDHFELGYQCFALGFSGEGVYGNDSTFEGSMRMNREIRIYIRLIRIDIDIDRQRKDEEREMIN